MNGKAKILTIFVLGLLLGTAGTFLFMGINIRKVMAIHADAQLFEMAVNARSLRAGSGEVLLDRYDDAIPSSAISFHNYHRTYLKGDHANAALWQVQRYYESNPSLKTSPEIESILAALPPRPLTVCEVNQEELTHTKALKDTQADD